MDARVAGGGRRRGTIPPVAKKAAFFDTQITLNGKKRRVVAWVGCCKGPSDATMVKEAEKRGVTHVVRACRDSFESASAVVYSRDGKTLKEEAKTQISIGSPSRLVDCSYDCPAGGRQDFNVWARKGESADQACRRKLGDRVDGPQVPHCKRLRAREIQ